MSWTPDAPNPCVPKRLQDVCKLYVIDAFANTCHARCAYCFADPQHLGFFPRDWTYEQGLVAWRRVAEMYGPTFGALCGLEPMEELPYVAARLQHHYASVLTNAMFDEEELYQLVPPDRLELHPSFHPHLWRPLPEAERFFGKIERIMAHGYQVPLIGMVGWPEWLPFWDEWIERIRALNVSPNPVPARDTERPDGRPLPDSYTDAELEILNRHIPAVRYDEQAQIRPLRVSACAAGVATCAIMPNGEVRRCAQVRGALGDQNLYRDGGFTLLEEPLPCAEPSCKCGNLHPYHVLEEVSCGS